MKSYLSLVGISQKVHKKQNRLINLCIIAAVFLVTAIFSMTDMMIRQETARLIEKHGKEQVQAFFSRTSVMTMYPVAAVLFLFILLSGVLMIAGSMNSMVAQKTKFFGMMRCIGMSKKQIIRMVKWEALHWCKKAIPIGILLGISVEWILCAVLKFGVSGEFKDMPQFGISISGIVFGIFVGLITVLLAAKRPAKRAAKISPVAAMTVDNNQIISKKVHAKTAFFKIETLLGIRHALHAKKNLFLMTGSFAFSIILFLSFSVLVNLVNCLLPQSTAFADVEITCRESDCAISSTLKKELSALEGVERVFGRRSDLDVKAESMQHKEISKVDIISFEEFDLESLKKDGVLERGSDIKKVLEESCYALVISDAKIKEDDTFSVYQNELKAAGRLKYDPFNADGSTGGKTTLIVSDETFTALTGMRDYSLLSIQLERGAADSQVDMIRACAGKRYQVKDCREENTRGTYLAFLCCTYGFLVVIAMVSLLNIVNSISMSVSARMKQYGAMRAVGMEKSQLIRMITAEAGTFVVSGCIVGLAVGLIISRWLHETLITSHFSYAAYELPVLQIGIILLFEIIAVAVGVYAPAKRISKMSITETISEL